MSLTKRIIDELERRDPTEDPYYGEEWPSEEEMRDDERSDQY